MQLVNKRRNCDNTAIQNQENKKKELDMAELKELTKRSEAFINEANSVGLEMLPFERGFFVCVPTQNPVRLMEKLYEYDTYVVVTKTCVRVALCAINENEAKVLPKIILDAKRNLGE